jgi:hypothetical protein
VPHSSLLFGLHGTSERPQTFGNFVHWAEAKWSDLQYQRTSPGNSFRKAKANRRDLSYFPSRVRWLHSSAASPAVSTFSTGETHGNLRNIPFFNTQRVLVLYQGTTFTACGKMRYGAESQPSAAEAALILLLLRTGLKLAAARQAVPFKNPHFSASCFSRAAHPGKS